MTIRTLLGTALLTLTASAMAELPLPLHIDGLQVKNSRNQPVLLRGVNAACLEWTSDGEGHILKTVDVAIKDWKVNIIRLPLAQDRWFGLAPEQTDKGVAYRALVKQVVDKVTKQGCYILLDLHWNDAGVWGTQIGQHVMPDMNSVTFWSDCARVYRNHPGVLYDLYNEPHNVTWDQWKNGGMVKDNGPTVRQPRTYQAAGMQLLLDTVRATGAKNVVVVGGLDWAYDMSGFLKGYTLTDKLGNGLIYANHTYTVKGDTIEKWLAKMEAASKVVPVIVSEFGEESRPPRPPAPGAPATANRPPQRQVDPKWLVRTVKALHDHKWNWIAWDMHVGAGPRVISDWNYTPTPSFGVPVKKELAVYVKP